jgi:hypothetical protein
MRVHGSSTLISFSACRFDDSVAVTAAAAFPPPAIDPNQEAGGLVQFCGQSARGAHYSKQNVEFPAQVERESVEIRGLWASSIHQLRLLDSSLNS